MSLISISHVLESPIPRLLDWTSYSLSLVLGSIPHIESGIQDYVGETNNKHTSKCKLDILSGRGKGSDQLQSKVRDG